MTLSWPDGDSLGLLPSDVCLFDVLSQPVKAPPPILSIRYPVKITYGTFSMTAAYHHTGVFQ